MSDLVYTPADRMNETEQQIYSTLLEMAGHLHRARRFIDRQKHPDLEQKLVRHLQKIVIIVEQYKKVFGLKSPAMDVEILCEEARAVKITDAARIVVEVSLFISMELNPVLPSDKDIILE